MSDRSAGTPPAPRSDLADFHTPAFRDWRWLETCWFGFFVPEIGLRGHVRAAFRVNLGVVQTMVYVFRRGGTIFDMEFADCQIHVPLSVTDRYSDFNLVCGLSVRSRSVPDRYSVRYRSRDRRCEMELEYQAMMPPVGLEYTKLPDAGEGFAAFDRPGRSGVDVGHIDQTFRVEGRLRIDDSRFDVRCVANHDHSWSPRNEFRSSVGTFDNLHFGDELTIFLQAAERTLHQPEVTHAYVLNGSSLRRVTRASVTYEREGLVTRRARYDITDETGERYLVDAPVRYDVGVDSGSNAWTHMHYLEPVWNGRVGYGECAWHCDISSMQALNRRAG